MGFLIIILIMILYAFKVYYSVLKWLRKKTCLENDRMTMLK